MEGSIEEVKKRIDIIEFIGQYVQLKRAGRNFKALCPFHNEKSASFVVSPERQLWHCFGTCHEGGDVIKFLMKWENVTFSEALQELADKAGVRLKKATYEDKEWLQKQRLLQINTVTAEFYEYILHNSPYGKKANEYLSSRGLNEKIMHTFQLGYAPASWSSLRSFLIKKKYRDEDLLQLGLVIRGARGDCYDRFRGRIMFPIKDPRGNVIGFSGRLLDTEAHEAKYVNSPETPLYRKRETLYGIHITKDAVKKENNVLLVEGEFDVIVPYMNGVENVVAVKGSAVTREQLSLLKRYTSRITLALDSDLSGQDAVKRAIGEIEEAEIDARVLVVEGGKDPDEAVRNNVLQFKQAITKAMPVYDFLIDLARQKYPTEDAYSKKKVGEEVLPIVSRIKNPIVQSHYIKKIANLLDVSESSISESAKKEIMRKRRAPAATFKKHVPVTSEREEVLERYVCSRLFQSEQPYQFSDRIFSILSTTDMTIPALRKICEQFLSFKQAHSTVFSVDSFVTTLSPELRSIFDEVYLFGSSDVSLQDVEIDKLVLELKKYSLKKRISQLLQKGIDGHELELQEWNQSLKEVEKRITTV